MFVCLAGWFLNVLVKREKERDRQTERQREKERETERKIERERKSERETDRQTNRRTDRQADRQSERQKENQSKYGTNSKDPRMNVKRYLPIGTILHGAEPYDDRHREQPSRNGRPHLDYFRK